MLFFLYSRIECEVKFKPDVSTRLKSFQIQLNDRTFSIYYDIQCYHLPRTGYRNVSSWGLIKKWFWEKI